MATGTNGIATAAEINAKAGVTIFQTERSALMSYVESLNQCPRKVQLDTTVPSTKELRISGTYDNQQCVKYSDISYYDAVKLVTLTITTNSNYSRSSYVDSYIFYASSVPSSANKYNSSKFSYNAINTNNTKSIVFTLDANSIPSDAGNKYWCFYWVNMSANYAEWVTSAYITSSVKSYLVSGTAQSVSGTDSAA